MTSALDGVEILLKKGKNVGFPLFLCMTHHTERDLMGIAKSIDSGQPAQSDHGRNFSLLADFPYLK